MSNNIKINLTNEYIQFVDGNRVIYDSRWNFEDFWDKTYGGKVEMTKEQVIKNMRDAIEANKHIREQTNNALSHAIGLLEKQDGEYERGLNEGWELAKKVVYMSTDDRFHAFGCKSPALTLEHHSGLDARKLYNEYMEEKKNKEEEAAKPKLGDVVIVRNPQCCFEEKGIYLTGGLKGFVYLTSNGTVVDVGGDYFTIEKTGEHVDIRGMLDKIG